MTKDNVVEFPEGKKPVKELKTIVHENGRKRREDCPFWTNLNNIAVLPEGEGGYSTRGDGIVVPTAGEYYIRGVVVAVGEGMIDDSSTRMPMHVDIGDKVILPNPAGINVDKIIMLNEVNVLGIEA